METNINIEKRDRKSFGNHPIECNSKLNQYVLDNMDKYSVNDMDLSEFIYVPPDMQAEPPLLSSTRDIKYDLEAPNLQQELKQLKLEQLLKLQSKIEQLIKKQQEVLEQFGQQKLLERNEQLALKRDISLLTQEIQGILPIKIEELPLSEISSIIKKVLHDFKQLELKQQLKQLKSEQLIELQSKIEQLIQKQQEHIELKKLSLGLLKQDEILKLPELEMLVLTQEIQGILPINSEELPLSEISSIIKKVLHDRKQLELRRQLKQLELEQLIELQSKIEQIKQKQQKHLKLKQVQLGLLERDEQLKLIDIDKQLLVLEQEMLVLKQEISYINIEELPLIEILAIIDEVLFDLEQQELNSKIKELEIEQLLSLKSKSEQLMKNEEEQLELIRVLRQRIQKGEEQQKPKELKALEDQLVTLKQEIHDILPINIGELSTFDNSIFKIFPIILHALHERELLELKQQLKLLKPKQLHRLKFKIEQIWRLITQSETPKELLENQISEKKEEIKEILQIDIEGLSITDISLYLDEEISTLNHQQENQ